MSDLRDILQDKKAILIVEEMFESGLDRVLSEGFITREQFDKAAELVEQKLGLQVNAPSAADLEPTEEEVNEKAAEEISKEADRQAAKESKNTSKAPVATPDDDDNDENPPADNQMITVFDKKTGKKKQVSAFVAHLPKEIEVRGKKYNVPSDIDSKKRFKKWYKKLGLDMPWRDYEKTLDSLMLQNKANNATTLKETSSHSTIAETSKAPKVEKPSEDDRPNRAANPDRPLHKQNRFSNKTPETSAPAEKVEETPTKKKVNRWTKQAA